jgi:molybdate transport system substrate-binding protein
MMRPRPWAALFGLLALSGCGAGSHAGKSEPSKSPPREISIAAAADLKFALDEIRVEFNQRHPDLRLNISYGSSGNFYSQLINQAPFDLYLSADVEYPRRLAKEGLVLPGSEFLYAVGRIAVWVPASSPIDVERLGMNSLSHATITHIAIANPQHAPYGRAAEAAMRSLGAYGSAKPKLVFGENVAQTLQFVQSGNAEIGIVALSLALAPTVRADGRFWEVPLNQYPRMDQGGVILKWAKDPDAARAVSRFLTGTEGRSVLKRYGFFLPEE